MTEDIFSADEDSTPLTPDEKRGLIPSYVSTRAELNREEQNNIKKAQIWAFSGKRNILGVEDLKKLHSRMYGDVWEWAGKFSQVQNRPIGVEPYQIETELRQLIDDVKFWLENETYPLDEIAARFHHKLVWIHPFPNGNGRFSRLAADILLTSQNQEPFTWGMGDLRSTANEVRQSYIRALREADHHNIEPLLEFVRSGGH